MVSTKTVAERLDALIAAAAPTDSIVLAHVDWMSLRDAGPEGLEDLGAEGLMYRGRKVYVGAETEVWPDVAGPIV